MKTLVTIIITLTVCLTFNAQGNLQFNQALLLNTMSNNQTQWTVPAGKVWKLESIGNASSGWMQIYIDGNLAFEYWGGSGPTGGYANIRSSTSNALWLPAGTILGHVANAGTYYRWFNIIEFNLVP
ncbi:MAG: hypothetical protein EB023_14160 [Flavobacteriia bacterium]|nr:hypothetical protein [Flavobacteriia bacterium]